MTRYRFDVLIGAICALAASAAAHIAFAATYVRLRVFEAFPLVVPLPLDRLATDAAPLVIGLPQTRAFRARRVDRAQSLRGSAFLDLMPGALA